MSSCCSRRFLPFQTSFLSTSPTQTSTSTIDSLKMPKIVFYDMPTRPGGPLFSPNTTPIKMALLHKLLPFVTVELSATELKSTEPGSFSERLGGVRTFVPMAELPLDQDGNVVEPTDEEADCRGRGLLLQDTLTIASLLDQFYPNRPGLFLPEVEKVDVRSKEWRTAYNFALLVKQGLGTSFSRWAHRGYHIICNDFSKVHAYRYVFKSVKQRFTFSCSVVLSRFASPPNRLRALS